jgi:hypothetical protein
MRWVYAELRFNEILLFGLYYYNMIIWMLARWINIPRGYITLTPGQPLFALIIFKSISKKKGMDINELERLFNINSCQSSTKLSEVNVKDTFTSHIDKKKYCWHFCWHPLKCRLDTVSHSFSGDDICSLLKTLLWLWNAGQQ